MKASGQSTSCKPKMKFTIACLAIPAIFATVFSAPSQPVVRFELYPLSGNSRITNGQNAVQGAHPYQVSVQWRRRIFNTPQHVCGGSIISSLWVVTAAHCFTDLPSGTVSVIAGKHNINSNEATQQARDIALRILHPSYAGGVNPDDIALIKLASPFNLNDFVAPINLPEINAVHSGNAVISGWGSTSLTTSPTRPIFLQTATVPIISTSECYDILTNVAANPPLDPQVLDNVCTGSPDNSRLSVCSGDSGGPLAQIVDGNWELVGVISWAVFPCGMVTAPSVYVRTSAYIDWINQQIADNS